MSAPPPSPSSQTALPTEYTNLLNDLNRTIHRERPRDILQFCANWFNKRLEEQRVELIHHSSYDPHSPVPQINTRRAQTETIFEEPFAPTSPRSGGPPPASSSTANTQPSTSSVSSGLLPSIQLPPQSPASLSFLSQDPNPTADFPPNYNLSRRTSVSAESLAPSQSSSPSVRRTSGGPQKTAQQQTRIRAAISANLLFKNLDDEQTRDVLDAMTEKRIPKEGVTVIHQGDVGDFFYVVEEGGFDFYIRKPGTIGQGLGERVGGVGAGGSFGELALMYNAPRAASVVSTSPGVLWALDRITFRRILMDHTSRKRKMYETFLSTVPLLSGLNTWEKAKIADALETEVFENGEVIISQGDVGEYFYLVESGEAEVIIEGRGIVRQYKRGDYFGELALLNDAPRAATVRALTNLKVAKLDKRAFQRLLGPIKDIMARNDPRLQEES